MKYDPAVLDDLDHLESACDPLNTAAIRTCVERLERELLPHLRRRAGLVQEHERLRVGLGNIRDMLGRVESDLSASLDLCAACHWLATTLRDHLRREAEYHS